MPPSLALNGRSWALNGLLGPSVGSLGSSIAPLGPDLLNKNMIAKTKIGLLEKIVPLFCFGQPYLDC